MTPKKAPQTQRRPRNPDATREQILSAARSILAADGPEGLKVSRVARLAGVNRGTAYQHFHTREELAKATAESVGMQLSSAMLDSEKPDDENDLLAHMDRLATYAIENPELARVWLFETLNAQDPTEDVFYKLFKESLDVLTRSEAGEENVDTEALAVILLAGYFLWPVWVRAHAHNDAERKRMAHRFSREVSRLCANGLVKAELYPRLAAMWKNKA